MTSKTRFDHFKCGLENLAAALGREHPHWAEFHALRERLVDNLISTITYGATPPRDAARAALLDGLNRLSREFTGQTFDSFCQTLKEADDDTVDDTVVMQKHRLLFKQYTDGVNLLLLKKRLEDPEVQKLVHARTFAVLRRLDAAWKGQIVQFLYDAKLISAESPVVPLAQADLTWAHLVEADLTGVDLARANLESANLAGAKLARSRLTQTIFSGANLGWATLEEAELGWAALGGATLTGVNFSGAKLNGAVLAMAKLKLADFKHADLEGANMLGAQLERANLRGARLPWANLLWANLAAADLTAADLTNATYNRHTEWPRGFDPVAAGARQVD